MFCSTICGTPVVAGEQIVTPKLNFALTDKSLQAWAPITREPVDLGRHEQRSQKLSFDQRNVCDFRACKLGIKSYLFGSAEED